MTHEESATIRPAVVSDAAEIARLFTELGHPASPADIASRWSAWEAEGNTALVALQPAGELAGVVTMHQMLTLHRTMRHGRIAALVVDERLRGQGVGRVLVLAAEQALVALGCELIEVTSNLRRVEAHAFYKQLGYEQTGARFVKTVGG